MSDKILEKLTQLKTLCETKDYDGMWLTDGEFDITTDYRKISISIYEYKKTKLIHQSTLRLYNGLYEYLLTCSEKRSDLLIEYHDLFQ